MKATWIAAHVRRARSFQAATDHLVELRDHFFIVHCSRHGWRDQSRVQARENLWSWLPLLRCHSHNTLCHSMTTILTTCTRIYAGDEYPLRVEFNIAATS